MASATVLSSRTLAPVASSAANRPTNSIPSIIHTPSVFTNKEWIIPPRPKPGRKPAADTPPTKRKAQNRAAQRAFRERRAARVGELEDCMKKMEEEDEREQEELRGQIQHLEEDVQKYHNMLLSWQQRCEGLERHLAEERRLRKSAETETQMLRMSQNTSTDAVPLPSRRSSNHTHCSSTKLEVNEPPPGFALDNEITMGCGKCSRDSRCECIEQAFALENLASDPVAPTKRPCTPTFPTDSPKRLRQSQHTDLSATEIDFTTPSSQAPPQTTLSSSIPETTAPPLDPCGFCSNGTPCICAEIVAEASFTDYNHNSATPLPSTTIQTPCINGPGTCAQCQVSSTSTLFCKALAATRAPDSSFSSPIPLLNAKPKSNIPSTQTTAITGPTFSCADAFSCLSRHPAFDRASDDLGSWMPRLATVPAGKSGDGAKEGGDGRTAFEVEAASVLEVLRFFDRRFGVQER